MFKKIFRVVFTVINTCLFTDKRIQSLLQRGVDDVLGNMDDFPFRVEIYFIDRFMEDDRAIIAENEPGSREDNPIALTIFFEASTVHMVFSFDGINSLFPQYNPLEMFEEIVGIGRHEAFHVLQYRYIFERGGMAAIAKLFAATRDVDYCDNILERGAYEFQYTGVVQDFEKDFAPYVA